MLYWLIPYLVAYNASYGSDWEYGPEHVFKAEIRTDAHRESPDIVIYTNVDMYMPCRTMNRSFIECRIESTYAENFRIGADGYRIPVLHTSTEELGLNDCVFQVEFDDKGARKIGFVKDRPAPVKNMIRAVIHVVNLSFDLADKNYGTYVSMENSTVGTCNANITLSKDALRSTIIKSEKVLKEYSFDVPAFTARTENEKVTVVEKHRNLNNCSKATPYFFGGPENGEEPNNDRKLETKVVSSQSTMFLGKDTFSAYTRNHGTYTISSLSRKDVLMSVKYHEVIRVSLDSIRPAKKMNSNVANLTSSDDGRKLS